MPPINYALHVDSGSFPSWSRSFLHRSPKLRVDVRASDQAQPQSTRLIKGDTRPVWDENILLRDVNPESSLVISVKDSSKAFLKDRCIGEVEIVIESLLAQSKDMSVPLKLKSHNKKRMTSDDIIHVRLSTKDSTSLANMALENANEEVTLIQPSKGQSTAIEAADYAVSGALLDNPIVQSLEGVVAKLDVLVNIVDKVAQVHPYVNLAWQVTSALYKAVRGQRERDQRLIDLVQSMEGAYSFVESVRDLPHKVALLQDNIEQLVTQTIECTVLVREYTGHGFSGRLFRQTLSSEVEMNMANMTQRFIELKATFTTGVVVYTATVSCQVLSVVENLERIEYLKRLEPVSMNASLRTTCLPNTRQSVLNFATEWVVTPSEGKNILWLHGLAGSGKSAIATTLAEYFRRLGRLGAFLFFSRDDAVQSNPAAVIRTLAYQLAQSNDYIGQAIANAIKTNQNRRIDEATLDLQVATLLLPLKSVSALEKQGPIVVLMDALDECGDVNSRKPLLRLLSKQLAQLPLTIRIIITSRNEPDIRTALRNKAHVDIREVTAGSSEDLADVSFYISHHLKELREDEDLVFPPEWPTDADTDALVKRSAGLFIWASTAVKFIGTGPDPAGQTQILCQSQLRNEAESALDEIYSLALKAVDGWNNDEHRSDFCDILGAIALGRIPMSDVTLDKLLGLEGSRSSVYILSRLTCLLEWSRGQPVRTLHASLAEYLCDQKRCGDQKWYIDITSHQLLLTKAAFRVMKAALRFNICGLISSHIHNGDVADLALRVTNNIPKELSYACQFWADHLKETPLDNDVLSTVQDFLRTMILYWMEVLSLTEAVASGITALDTATLWLTSKNAQASQLAKDAQRFLSYFRKPISESAPHIYLSALPFSPTTSTTAQQFLADFRNTLDISQGKPDTWPSDVLILESHTDSVNEVVISPDGKFIASCSDDKTVLVWDAATGEVISGPFQGHTSTIQSLAFSPDGKRIASGSGDHPGDNAVRVWDTESGEMVSGPFHGHEFMLNKIAFSPDGKRIASSSWDKTVRVWDAQTGEMALGLLQVHGCTPHSVAFSPNGQRIASGLSDGTLQVWDAKTGERFLAFQGHAERVNSVAFSSDGKLIVSGSNDKTLRVWDADTAEVVLGPLCGHTDWIRSVAFSSDDKRIVSGSNDMTIRVWDTRTGEVVLGPFRGHTGWVYSVAFYPDGKRIASGSTDKTVRVWDVEAGAEVEEGVSQLFSGYTHLDNVNSVGFSPDSKRIVSSSKDNTVLVWDAESGDVISGPFQGHALWVLSVGFSPDGGRIVSGAADRTLRVWDAETGKMILEPFQGHTDWVHSVSFSPDGKHIASGSSDKTVRVWEAETAVLVVGFQANSGYASVAFSPDGKWIAAGLADGTVCVLDPATGGVVSGPIRRHTEWVSSVMFSPDGKRVVSGSRDATVSVWDAETGEVACGPFKKLAYPVTSVAYSPEGKRVAAASDGITVLVLDAETGDVTLGPLRGHTGPLHSVAFSPDGKRIASGSSDFTVRVWDAEMPEVALGQSQEGFDGGDVAPPAGATTNFILPYRLFW